MHTNYILFILIMLIIGELMASAITQRLQRVFANSEEIVKSTRKARKVFAISSILGFINFLIIVPFLPSVYRYISAIVGEEGAFLIFTIIGATLGFIHYSISKFIYLKLDK